MQTIAMIATLLFFITLGYSIWGILIPQLFFWNKPASRAENFKQGAMASGVTFLIFIVLAIIAGPPKETQMESSEKSKQSQSTDKATASKPDAQAEEPASDSQVPGNDKSRKIAKEILAEAKLLLDQGSALSKYRTVKNDLNIRTCVQKSNALKVKVAKLKTKAKQLTPLDWALVVSIPDRVYQCVLCTTYADEQCQMGYKDIAEAKKLYNL